MTKYNILIKYDTSRQKGKDSSWQRDNISDQTKEIRSIKLDRIVENVLLQHIVTFWGLYAFNGRDVAIAKMYFIQLVSMTHWRFQFNGFS